MKQFKILVILGVLIALMGMTGCSKNPLEGKLEAEFQLGYDSLIKVQADNPLTATIKNNGPAFEGELQVQVEDASNKYIVAMPFEMAENSSKEIHMDIPTYIIQRKFQVEIVVEGDVCFKDTIRINTILSPQQNVMAVITDTPDAYRFLENTQLRQESNPYDQKAMTGVATEETKTALEVIYFDSLDSLDTIEKMDFFNYIYIGHNQSLNISGDSERVLNEWIEKGNGLIIETGADYKKTQSILPDSLYPVKATGTAEIQLNQLWGALSLDHPVTMATIGSLDPGSSYVSENGANLGILTKKGNGGILTLLGNLSLEPISTWPGRTLFLENILEASLVQTEMGYFEDPYYTSPYQYMLQNIPSDKEPPYLFIVILLLIYIVLVGPVLYFVLKKMDKRDYAWVTIPLTAIVCILILFIGGRDTRYNKAVMNSISILTAKESDAFMEVESNIAILNNKKGDLVMEWDQKEDLAMNFTQNNYYTYDDGTMDVSKTLRGKLTLGLNPKFQLYETNLWEPNYTTGTKLIPFTPGKLITMSTEGANGNLEIKIKVKNITPFKLKYAFLKWGNGNIPVGDLEPGEEKTIESDMLKLQGSNTEAFFQQLLGYTPAWYGNSGPTNPELGYLYEIMMQRYVYMNYNNGLNITPENFGDITLCALNDQPVGYELTVNGDEVESYSTNVVEIKGQIDFEQGTNIVIPSGLIVPSIVYYLDVNTGVMGNYEYQYYDNYLRFYEKGVAYFSFAVPKEIQVISGTLAMQPLYKEQDTYNMGTGQLPAGQEGVIYFVYNSVLGEYQEMEPILELKPEFISEEGLIQIKMDFSGIGKDQSDYSYVQMMQMPSLTIEGSVK